MRRTVAASTDMGGVKRHGWPGWLRASGDLTRGPRTVQREPDYSSTALPFCGTSTLVAAPCMAATKGSGLASSGGNEA